LKWINPKKRSERRRLQKKVDRVFAATANNIEEEMEIDVFPPSSISEIFLSEMTSKSSFEVVSEPDSPNFSNLEDLYSTDDFLTDNSTEDSEIFNTNSETVKIDINSLLATWAVKYGLRRDALNELLLILGSTGLDLPKDSRTLLKTPRSVEMSFSNDNNKISSYSYLGVSDSIQNAIDSPLLSYVIELIVNIDGLPLFKSTNAQLWPILGSIFHSNLVFPIAFFCGNSKPTSLDNFLSDFIEEVKKLTEEGINIKGKNYEFCLKAFISDAPARSFLKCIVGHTGYFSCERCVVKGEYHNNRVTFNGEDICQARTKESFNLFLYDNHQKACSPLVNLNVDCILDFPLDYMHLVLLSVVKRMLVFLTKGPKTCRLSNQQVSLLSERLVALNGKLPSDFNRQPRRLNDLCYWKATEFRSFLFI